MEAGDKPTIIEALIPLSSDPTAYVVDAESGRLPHIELQKGKRDTPDSALVRLGNAVLGKLLQIDRYVGPSEDGRLRFITRSAGRDELNDGFIWVQDQPTIEK